MYLQKTNTSMIILKLDTISSHIQGITTPFWAYMAECAAVCFHSQGHKSGIKLPFSNGETIENSLVEWTIEVTDKMMSSYFDEKRTTDFGAMGVSILLASNLTDYTHFSTSETNNGFDFWLTKSDDDLNFISARLEISGIRKETKQNTVKSRLKIKEKQILKSANSRSICYVSIIEFSKPEAKFIQK